jgi:tetratricopeptide (TPR) repeat protein
MTRTRVLAAAAVVALAGGCATAPAPAPPASVAQLYEQPAERDFLNGLRLYEEGQYERAETLFRRALSDGLKNPYDVSMANKHLAFIACAYSRPLECENAFRAAFAADPAFRLSDAEVGHPLWGPVYKRVAAEEATKAGPAR